MEIQSYVLVNHFFDFENGSLRQYEISMHHDTYIME